MNLPTGFSEPRKLEQQPTEANRQNQHYRDAHKVRQHSTKAQEEEKRRGR